jgi:glycosyltransferase involved in cell wall biosynthesis
VVLVPSLHEAYGLVTLEALAASVPVVGSASGGTRDLLTTCGLLAVPGDAGHFASLVAAIADDSTLRSWMLEQGQRVVGELDPDAEATAVRVAVEQACTCT